MEKMLGVLRGAPAYVVTAELGQGGMGVVYLANVITAAGQRRVAIKRVGRHADPEVQERILAEAQLVFQLTHANICQVLDLASSDDGTFIVMEYVDGMDLHRLWSSAISRKQPISPSCALYVARQIAQALDYAHRRTGPDGQPLYLVHGDVTPANVLLSREGEVKLTDFGIARAVGVLAPGNELLGGTPGFTAPEVASGQADFRSDVFSLGATLYFTLSDHREGEIDLNRLRNTRSDIPSALLQIIETATSPDKEQRYATAADLESALSLCLSRSFPAFRQGELGDLVRAHFKALPSTALKQKRTLVSIAGAPTTSVSSAAAADSESVRRKSPLPGLALAVGVISALVVAAVVWFSDPSEPVVQSEPVQKTEPAPSPPQPVAPTAPTVANDTASEPAAKPKARAPAAPTQARSARPTLAASQERGFLTVHAEPWGSVLLDGEKVADETPLYRFPVGTGPHSLVVENPDTRKRSSPRSVVVKAGKNHVLGINW